MVGLAEEIIDRMTGEFEPDKFEDRYENAMIELIRTKQAGLPAKVDKAPSRPANVVNLMDALRRSVEGETGKGKPAVNPELATLMAKRKPTDFLFASSIKGEGDDREQRQGEHLDREQDPLR